jgi:peptidoglycan/xylan/chitin deacetylase (PgdA/CDA1 family)
MHASVVLRAAVVGSVLAAWLTAAPSSAAATPTPTSPVSVRFVAAQHTGYRFDTAWNIIATKTRILERPSSARAIGRQTIDGRVHLRMSTGIWAGYWIRESTLAYIGGFTGETTYSPVRRVPFAAGTYLGYRFDSSGRLTATKARSLTVSSGARADRRAIINGRPYVRMVDGIWAGYWMPGSSSRATAVACQTGSHVAAGTQRVIRSVSGAGPEMSLTFDLGGRTTPARAILDQLLIDRVCATVFPTAATAATTEGRAILAVVRAHPELFEVGNHTQHHCNLRDGGGGASCPTSPPSAAFIRGELTSAEPVITAVAGQDPTPYWRPPYGAYDARVLTAAADAGYTRTFMWSIDTIDWRPERQGGPTAYDIALKIRTNAASGTIVLSHLGGYNTLDALPYALAGLRANGLQPTSLSDLLDPRR